MSSPFRLPLRYASILALAWIVLQPARAEVALETVATALDAPVAVTHAGDGRLFISELRGKVLVLEDGEILPQPFLDVTDRVLGTGHGLLNIAFHPDYAENGFVYAHLAEKGTADSILVRYRVSDEDPGRVDPESEVELLRIVKTIRRHYGGQLRFGPDGYLYVSTGDGTGTDPDTSEELVDPECASQDTYRLEGKLLRLDVDRNVYVPPYHGVPDDNPFLHDGLGEVWAKGLRNPWRFSFDRETGDLWLSDVGHDEREEVNFQPAGSPGGQNYGWKIMEGTSCFGDLTGCMGTVPACNSTAITPPVLEYSHRSGCSVTGGFVYRGSLVPELYGRYIYGDYCEGTIWAAERLGGTGDWQVEELPVRLPGLVSIDEDATGELLLTDHFRGEVHRLVDPTIPDAGLIELEAPRWDVSEGDGEVIVGVRRVGKGSGEASVEVRLWPTTAEAGVDYRAPALVLSWGDGETGTKPFPVELIDDTEDEPLETANLRLTHQPGAAALGARRQAMFTIADNDEPTCVADSLTLCLNKGRFRVSADWRSADRQSFAYAVSEGEDAGSFWFFSAKNPEVYVKVLDACHDPFRHYWVFAAGLTNVEVTLRVVDTRTGATKTYKNPLGKAFQPITDTQAFATCP